MTTTNGVASLRLISDEIDGFDLSPSDTEEVHVLAVDDSFVDRKVIERLLTISSCRDLYFLTIFLQLLFFA